MEFHGINFLRVFGENRLENKSAVVYGKTTFKKETQETHLLFTLNVHPSHIEANMSPLSLKQIIDGWSCEHVGGNHRYAFTNTRSLAINQITYSQYAMSFILLAAV